MRKGRCQHSAFVSVRTSVRLRDDAGEALRRKGLTVSDYVRDQLQRVVQEANNARA